MTEIAPSPVITSSEVESESESESNPAVVLRGRPRPLNGSQLSFVN